MDDLSKQMFGFTESGMITLPDRDFPSYWPHNAASGAPNSISVSSVAEHSSAYIDRMLEGHVQDEDEDRRELVRVNINFLGADDNEPHGLSLEFSPELATVIANAMLTHASSVIDGETVSKTLIQSMADYEADETFSRSLWEQEYRLRLGLEPEDEDSETEGSS